MGSGPTQTTRQLGTQNFLPWAQEPAKALYATLLNYISPGASVPSSWFSNKGFTYPTGGGLTAPKQGAGGGGSFGGGGATGGWDLGPLASVLNDPVQNALFSPMISGSTALQNLAMNDPAAIWGATSPAASAQLGSIYGPQSTYGLNWIPGFNPGPFARPSTQQMPRTAGTSQVG